MSRKPRSPDEIRESWPYGDRRTYAQECARADEFGLEPVDVLILKALSHGLGVMEIPAVTSLTFEEVVHRVRFHIKPKLRAKNHAQAIAHAFRAGLIS